ncbi:MAG TPA: energy transducer TonB [Stellaceae bacterium]|nr:energy transducer TonB [Stellaceae bacterium]
MSATDARREPVLDRPEPLLRRRYPATAGTPDDRLGPIAGARSGMPAFGPLGSFGLHLAIVLILFFHPPLPGRPAPALPPIPVALVVLPAKPKPAPLPAPPKPKPPPPGRLASVDMGPTTGAESAPKPGPQAGGPQQLEAAALPLPPPPKLAAPSLQGLAPRPPASKARPRPAALEGRRAKYPGPSATRDEYLAYLAMLTRRHMGLLTPQLLGGRRGATVIEVLVLDDGAVARITVAQSSGYPDIDRKVEEIVRAVGRFPPLPQYVQGPSWDLKFFFPFPDSLQE